MANTRRKVTFNNVLQPPRIPGMKKIYLPPPPGVNFINILQAAFTHADTESSKKTDDLTVFLRLWDLCK